MPEIRVATQPLIWNQTYRRKGENYLDHLEEWLGKTKAAGIDFVALNQAMFAEESDTKKLADALAATSMRPVDCFVSGPCHVEELADETIEAVVEVARQAKSAGAVAITINPQLFK